jgi:hypothetical protein
MRKKLVFGLVVAVLSVLFAVVTPRAEASAEPAVPKAASSCVVHTKYASVLGFNTGTSYIYYSNAGWYRSIWQWDSCGGGVYLKVAFSTDCRLHYWESSVAPNGDIMSTWQIGTRGASCNATPGTLRFQKNGAVKTFSGANTELSSTGYAAGPNYQWEFDLIVDVSYPYVRERLLQSFNGGLIIFWYGLEATL